MNDTRSGPQGRKSIADDRTGDGGSSLPTAVDHAALWVDDFEEDTLLPPPAPGLVAPAAEHLFDPPTWPGIGAPLRTGPQAARLAAQVGTPMARRPPASRSPLPPSGPSPAPLPVDDSLLVPVGVVEAVSHSDETRRIELSSLPAAAETTATAATTSETLPPLPQSPTAASATALLSYLFQVGWSRWRRQQLTRKVEQSLGREVETLDRLLIDLGQLAYVESIDLLALYPALASDTSDSEPSPQSTAHRVERWAARIDAEQLRTLALLGREEARLGSELLRCLELRRDPLLRDEPTLREEWHLLLPRLAAVRLLTWVKERARAHCQAQPQQLLQTLSDLLQTSERPPGQPRPRLRPPPNLRLLGALLSSHLSLAADRLVEPWLVVQLGSMPGRPPGRTLSPLLFQPIWRLLDRLLPQSLLLGQASIERLAYDGAAVRRGLLMIAVGLATVGLCAAIALWAVLGG